jgi:hypothetical protein
MNIQPSGGSMFATASKAEALQRPRFGKFQDRDVGQWVLDYFDNAFAASLANADEPTHAMKAPQAYLVKQAPNSTVPAHFHLVDQFQVVVGGGGRIGKHAVSDVVIHYTNAHTPYGPIISEDQGIDYFTLRNNWDMTSAHPMPESRLELSKNAQRRHVLLESIRPGSDSELKDLTATDCDALYAREENGVGVWRYRMPPGARAMSPPP